jgi:hypothetical protein
MLCYCLHAHFAFYCYYRRTYLLYRLNFCSEYLDSALLPFVTGKLSKLAINKLTEAFNSST